MKTTLVVGAATTALVLAVVLVQGPAVLIAVVAMAIVFVPLEWLFAFKGGKLKRSALLTDLTHATVSVGVSTFVLSGMLLVAEGPLEGLSPLDVEHSVPPLAAVAIALVVISVAQYWSHRLEHRVAWLWKIHAVHHSSEHVYWLSSIRAHPLDLTYNQVAGTFPLLLLGYGRVAFGAVFLIVLQLETFYSHSNVRGRIPGLRWIIATPEYHHWHHSRFADGRSRNFGHPLVDVIFGTVHLPPHERAEVFGTGDPVPESYFGQLAYPFRRRRVPDRPAL